MEVLDNVDGKEEGNADGGVDVVLEVVEAVEIEEDEGFVETELVEAVVVVAWDEAEDWEAVVEEVVDGPVLIKLDKLDCFAVHDLVPDRRTNPSLHTHPRWSDVTREF